MDEKLGQLLMNWGVAGIALAWLAMLYREKDKELRAVRDAHAAEIKDVLVQVRVVLESVGHALLRMKRKNHEDGNGNGK